MRMPRQRFETSNVTAQISVGLAVPEAGSPLQVPSVARAVARIRATRNPMSDGDCRSNVLRSALSQGRPLVRGRPADIACRGREGRSDAASTFRTHAAQVPAQVVAARATPRPGAALHSANQRREQQAKDSRNPERQPRMQVHDARRALRITIWTVVNGRNDGLPQQSGPWQSPRPEGDERDVREGRLGIENHCAVVQGRTVAQPDQVEETEDAGRHRENGARNAQEEWPPTPHGSWARAWNGRRSFTRSG